MKFSDQNVILIHSDLEGKNLYGVSNNDGVFAYFPDKKLAYEFAHFVALTARRIELLEPEQVETIYNELDLINQELDSFYKLYK